ncbi:MAG: M28 family peptidase [Acidobacteriaceae bacterium]
MRTTAKSFSSLLLITGACVFSFSQSAPSHPAPQHHAPGAARWVVKPQWVQAHEDFLASDALEGRGSATQDEWIAATYVGSRFESYGLKPAPGAAGYVQAVELESPQLDGKAQITVGGATLDEGTDFYLFRSSGESASGKLQTIPLADLKSTKPQPESAVLVTGDLDMAALRGVSRLANGGAKLAMVEDSQVVEGIFAQIGGKTRVPVRVKGNPPGPLGGGFTMVVLKPDAIEKVKASKQGDAVELTVHTTPGLVRHTYNAMGWLQGTDPASGTILLTSHLDHLGVGVPVNGDAIYNGADDDAAGTTAVLELAHAMASGARLKRNILFVCFGSEEQGGMGADYFREHPPVPLKQIVANLEFEMIGAQDPKMPKDTLLLTGWERSNLGPTLRAHGAKLGPDPYPEQNFFQRSDNYALALKGVVAQTAAGWGTPPYYHKPDDDLQHLNVGFMTTAIQSLIRPIRWLANSSFRPAWNPGGEPK